MTDDRSGPDPSNLHALTSPKGPSSLARRQDQAARRARAVELRAGGATMRQIGVELGISESGAHRLIGRTLARDVRADVDRMRAVESQRLGEVEQAIWPAVLSGDLAAVDVWLRLSARRCKLFGLDAAHRVELSVEVRDGLDRALADLERLVLGADLDETDRP